MAATYKTEGIILKRWDVKEADRMVCVFTRDYGKITARAISVRKNGAKLTGHLEPYTHVDLFFARSKTIDIVAGANTLTSHKRLRQSVPHVALTGFFVDVLDSLTQERDVDMALYAHVLSVLNWLDTHDAQVIVLYAMLLQLSAHVGYELGLYDCHQCKKPIQAVGAKLHYDLWNVECANCVTPESTTPLSTHAVKVLRFMTEQPYEHIARLSMEPAVWAEVDTLVRSLLRYHLESTIPAEGVLLQLLRK